MTRSSPNQHRRRFGDMKFLCWRPDMDHDPNEDGEVFDDSDPVSAAEAYVDKHFSDWSYPRDCDVMVRNVTSGDTVAVSVTVESVPSFHGEIKKL